MTTGGKRWRRYESSAIPSAYPATSLASHLVILTMPFELSPLLGSSTTISNKGEIDPDRCPGLVAFDRNGSVRLFDKTINLTQTETIPIFAFGSKERFKHSPYNSVGDSMTIICYCHRNAISNFARDDLDTTTRMRNSLTRIDYHIKDSQV